MSHDWSKLLNDENIKNSYAVEIRSRFEQLKILILITFQQKIFMKI